MIATLRAAVILVAFLVLTLICIPIQALAVRFRLPWVRRFPHLYHRAVCAIFGIRVAILGQPVEGGVLLVANHAGWIDIPVLSATLPLSFVAKSEVNTWPFFGLLARLQRTVFVEREDRSRLISSRDSLRARLLAADALVLFPEGTSTDGNRVHPFRPALFSAAELSLGPSDGANLVHAPVQPVSVAYVNMNGIPMGRENRPFVAWYGDMDLVPHIWELLRQGPIDVIVEFHKPLTVEEAGGRRALAAAAEHAVRDGLARALSGQQAGVAHGTPAVLPEMDDDAGKIGEDEAA